MRSQQSLTPDKPFFIYFATGATHAPHHVPADWVDRYEGKFDDGWDAKRAMLRSTSMCSTPDSPNASSTVSMISRPLQR